MLSSRRLPTPLRRAVALVVATASAAACSTCAGSLAGSGPWQSGSPNGQEIFTSARADVAAADDLRADAGPYPGSVAGSSGVSERADGGQLTTATLTVPNFAATESATGPNGRGAPRTFEDAVAWSDIVAVGLTTAVETTRGASVVTVDVSHFAKGRAGPRISVRSLNEARLAALVPVLVFARAVSSDGRGRVLEGLVFFFGRNRSGEPVPVFLQDFVERPRCQAEDGGVGGCTLARLLALAKLRSMTPRGPSGSYRVRNPRTCQPCELEPWASQLIPDGARRCDAMDGGSPLGCVRQSMTAGEPFVVWQRIRGIDSQLRRVAVSTDGGAFYLWYDSSLEGGGECSAFVGRTPCKSWALNAGATDDKWLECMSALRSIGPRLLKRIPPGGALARDVLFSC